MKKIKALIIPKFEIGDMSEDTVGEANLYYREYCAGGDIYDIDLGNEIEKIYLKDGVMLFVCGTTKTTAALHVDALLRDERFDFSDAYIISIGCAGAAMGVGIMGDVCLASAIVDYDIGHRIDPRELLDSTGFGWFMDESLNSGAVRILNGKLIGRVLEISSSITLDSTEFTEHEMKDTFGDAEWTRRSPKIIRGTSVTSDNYWKGYFEDSLAKEIVAQYKCPDPFTVSEMEDIAVARACEQNGLLDRLIAMRVAVDMDVFMSGSTPEGLWSRQTLDTLTDENSDESFDIFPVAMKNSFKVGKTIIDAILNNTFM